MRVFLTGATGFIGSAVIPELLGAGHTVLGLARSDAGAELVRTLGAEVHRGDIEDLDSIRKGAENCDAVIHTAFNHDFSKFAANCETDRRVIETLVEVLEGSGRTLIVTSGTGVLRAPDGSAVTEKFRIANVAATPRAASEEAALAAAERGVKTMVMRLSQIHDTRKQGLVSYAIMIARQKGVAAYVGEGQNRWPAAPRLAVAKLYQLALDKGTAGGIYHAVAEEGVTTRAITESIAAGLKVPAVSLTPEQAMEHFGWLGMFAAHDLPASSALTQAELGWKPVGPTLIEDLRAMDYSAS